MSEEELADVEGVDVEAGAALRPEDNGEEDEVSAGVFNAVESAPEAAMGEIVVGDDESVNTSGNSLLDVSETVNTEIVFPLESTSTCCTTDIVAVTWVTTDASAIAVACLWLCRCRKARFWCFSCSCSCSCSR
jgi:hypothetical protein